MSSAAVPLHTGDARSEAGIAGDPLSLAFLSFLLSLFLSDLSFDVLVIGFSFTVGAATAVLLLLSDIFCSSAGLGSQVSGIAGGREDVSSSALVSLVSSEFFAGPLTSLPPSFTGVLLAVDGRLRFRFPCFTDSKHTENVRCLLYTEIKSTTFNS